MPFWWCTAITKITPFLIFVSPFSAVYRLLADKQGDKWFILDRAVKTKEQFYMSSFTCWDSTMSTTEQIEIPIYEFTSKTLPMVCLLAWENSRYSRLQLWFSRELTSENRAQKFHTDDASLHRSGWCFWLLALVKFALTNQKHDPDLGIDSSPDVISRKKQWRRRENVGGFLWLFVST